jgi:anaerobic dimethyl sulfoxide reductase subunit B (iron-sulfur subunit)
MAVQTDTRKPEAGVPAPSQSEVLPQVPTQRQRGFLFNQDHCIGCRACEAACKQEFNLPVGLRRRRVITQMEGTYPDVAQRFVSVSCNHCAEPACVKACPAGALFKRAKDGIVLFDDDKCIGCRRCGGACPYGAPQYHPETGKVNKCVLCYHRLDEGLPPACVVTCMGLALEHATLAELDKRPGLKREVKGFADPDLTRPSVRFIPARK